MPPVQEHHSTSRKRPIWHGVKFVLGAPFAALGTEHILKNAAFIGALADRIKTGPDADRWVCVDDDQNLDVEAMATRAGISINGIQFLLANRRRQTARAAFCYLAGGGGFIALWLVESIRVPAYASIAYIIGLLAICTAFFLSAFYNALVNWQIRTMRLGTALEFLRTEESWWPS
jgi:hypothetical protein